MPDTGFLADEDGNQLIDSGNDILPENVGGLVWAPFQFGVQIASTASTDTQDQFMDCAANTAIEGYVMPKGGSVVGVFAQLNTVAASATNAVTFTVYNGATASATATINIGSGASSAYTAINKDAVTFAAGDVLKIAPVHGSQTITGTTYQAIAGFFAEM